MSMLFKTTSYVTTGALGTSLITSLLRKKKEGESPKIKTIHDLKKIIFGVATTQYVINLNIKNFETAQKLRYLDWVITTPLLLRALHLLAEEKGYTGSFLPALGANILMVAAGYQAEHAKTNGSRQAYYTLGLVMFAIVLKEVHAWGRYLKSQDVNVNELLIYFYVGWTVYGVNFINPNEDLRQVVFNISDLINKSVYGLSLDRVIDSQF